MDEKEPIKVQESAEEQEFINRRKFLEIATLSIGGAIALGVALPAIPYIAGPVLKTEDAQEWIRIGSASKVEIGIPTLYKVKITRQVGWNTTEEERAVYIVTENGSDFTAISNTCTHLGCRVRWIGENEQFFCPCHNGIFDKAGNVVAGPPPEPLAQYPVKVEDNQLYVLVG